MKQTILICITCVFICLLCCWLILDSPKNKQKESVDNSRTDSTSFGEILRVVLLFSFALSVVFLLISLNTSEILSTKHALLSSAISSTITAIATLGLIYVTKNVSESVNNLSTQTRREDIYAERIFEILLMIQGINMPESANQESVWSQTDCNDINTIIRYCNILKYYTEKHPSINKNNQLENLLNAMTNKPDRTILDDIYNEYFRVLLKQPQIFNN